jgi:glycosyltransferase involved in cell wall biosynthesis
MTTGAARPRLLIISVAGLIGGTERVAVTLAREFGERGWDVRTVFPDEDSGVVAWARGQGVEADVHRAVVPMQRERSLADMRRMRAMVRGWRPDAVNLHYPGNHISIKDVLAVRLAGRHRCVVNVHLPSSWEGAGTRKRAMTRAAAALTDGVVVHSRQLHDVMRTAGVSASKLRIIPNGVRPPAMVPSRADARRRLGVPDTAFVVVTLGRLVPVKGIDRLIGAVATLGAGAATVLLIAGDGPERGRLEAAGAKLPPGGCRLLGEMDDPSDLLAAADAFALPSLLEGYPLVLLEAAFFGLPCIATDVGGVREAVTDGGTGLIVPPGDEGALASALAALRGDGELRERLGRAARERAEREFTSRRMADSYGPLFSRGPGGRDVAHAQARVRP